MVRKVLSNLILGEACLLFLAALFLVLESLVSQVKNYNALLGEICIALLLSIGLFFASRAIKNNKRYGNSPALLANLIAIAVSYYIYEAGRYFIAGLLFIFSVVSVLGILYITAQSEKSH